MAQQMDKNTQLELHVVNPDKVIYQGTVKSVSGKNKKGPFDILGYHTNFVTIVDGSITIRELDGKKQEIAIGSGIMKVYKNVVYIFSGIEQETKPN